jgi:protein TonB
MERHLTTPADMGEEEQVEVRVRFVVGFDGKLQSFEIVKDGGTVFNDEVIRVMKKMPDWVPGRSNGEKVSVYFTMPVKFIATAP